MSKDAIPEEVNSIRALLLEAYEERLIILVFASLQSSSAYIRKVLLKPRLPPETKLWAGVAVDLDRPERN